MTWGPYAHEGSDNCQYRAMQKPHIISALASQNSSFHSLHLDLRWTWAIIISVSGIVAGSADCIGYGLDIAFATPPEFGRSPLVRLHSLSSLIRLKE
jgi:hypothetical protein